MASDRMARLDPEERALVELFDRGMSADDIAAVVGLEPAEVERRHRAARLKLGPEPRPPAERRSRRGAVMGGLAVLLVGVVVAIAIAAGGGEDEGDDTGGGSAATDVGATSTLETETTAVSEEELEPVTMQRLNGTYGRGTAQIVQIGEEARLRLRVGSFLRPVGGGYAVWLFNSPDDARRLYTTDDTSIERDFRLPPDFEDYRYVEVARAIPELDSDYSGLELLRARVDQLTQP
jgi:hypothetical protein